MCMCVCVCMHGHDFVSLCVCVCVCTCTRMRVHARVCVHTCVMLKWIAHLSLSLIVCYTGFGKSNEHSLQCHMPVPFWQTKPGIHISFMSVLQHCTYNAKMTQFFSYESGACHSIW